MSASRQVVFLFNEGDEATRTPAFRGGKGAGLADMVALGLPVPPGFTIATSVARAFAETGQLPKRLEGQIRRSMRVIEKLTGQKFGDTASPLLVSVRSGAPVSMPGMMDTVLNVGLRREMLGSLESASGREFADDTYERFLRQFGSAVLDLPVQDDQLLIKESEGLVPEDPYEQLMMAIRAVLLSWNSERARTYRDNQGIPHWWGTAVTIQAMAFGNRDDQSATGVVFSHDVNTGAEVLTGEFLVRAQGEDIVSGTTTPQSINRMQAWNPQLYQELLNSVRLLSDHLDSMVDVEFTVDNGKLFILQVRRATRTPHAAAAFAVRRVWSQRWTHVEAVTSLSEAELEQLEDGQAMMEGDSTQLIAAGMPASNGCAVGEVVYSSERAVELSKAGRKVVLVRPDTSPEDLPGMLAAVAVVTARGGMSCHAAVVCRGLNRPAVVGASGHLTAVGVQPAEGTVVSVDGTSGMVYYGEQPVLGGGSSKEVRLIQKWSRQQTPREIVFSTLSERQSANAFLAAFYMTEAMAHKTRGSELEVRARKLHESVVATIAPYFATYLVLAIGGEIRHFRGSPFVVAPELRREYRLDEFFSSVTRPDAQELVVSVLEGKSAAEQAQFAELAAHVFKLEGRNNWDSGAFGGPRWAKIAETLHGYVAGTTPASVFVDAVFDLRHNGGVLFNKHSMFTVHTMEHELHRMLELKKHHTIQEMWSEFQHYDSSNWWSGLYRDGQKAKLW